MDKIKIFKSFDRTHEGFDGIENQINEFIKDKTIIKIVQSETVVNDFYSFTITVLYNETI